MIQLITLILSKNQAENISFAALHEPENKSRNEEDLSLDTVSPQIHLEPINWCLFGGQYWS